MNTVEKFAEKAVTVINNQFAKSSCNATVETVINLDGIRNDYLWITLHCSDTDNEGETDLDFHETLYGHTIYDLADELLHRSEYLETLAIALHNVDLDLCKELDDELMTISNER